MTAKKIITKSIDPQTAIRMFILESNFNLQDSKKAKRQNIIQEKYKLLSPEQKIYIAKFTSDIIKSKYLNQEKFTNQIYAYSVLSSSEKKWAYTQKLIEFLSQNLNDDFFVKKICEFLFEIIDHEFSIEPNESTVAANCLALIIDLGVQLSEKKHKNQTNNKHSLHIIEYITSNLLSRGNINNVEIRIALVYYLSKVEENSKINLHKILSRFGQSLLEHIFYKYFSNSKSSQVAYAFLIEHLCKFLSGSAHLAGMGNSVLQNQMLKNPNEFLTFLQNYLHEIKNNPIDMKTMTIHISFLLKKSCEVNKLELIEKLKEMIINHLTFINTKSNIEFSEQCEIVINILSEAHSKSIRESIRLISSFYFESKRNTTEKITHKYFQSSNKQKVTKIEEKYQPSSPFEEILLLAK